MRARWPTKPTMLLAMLLGLAVPGAVGKHIAVFGGIMRSHHLAVVPLIEGLLERGHDVSFVVPNTTEHRSYFPDGVGSATMVYLGTEDWAFDTLLAGPEYDFKNLPWYKVPRSIARVLSNYRAALDLPLFSMHDALGPWLARAGVDAALLHVASLGSAPVVAASGTPWVSYLSVPPLPLFLERDRDRVCRYPNYVNPPRVAVLKASLAARVRNHIACRLVQGYMIFADHELRALFEARGLAMENGLLQMISDAPALLLLGGPPLSLNVKLGSHVHVLGVVDRSRPRPLPADLLAWLDAARDAGAPVVYVSMGTKYELHADTCARLVASIDDLTTRRGVRVLWSLRASQQATLRALLPAPGARVRIEPFAPQPEVLRHAAVTAFVSHCGWGGVADAIGAGVPVLGYPGMQDQFTNARMLEQAGAGVLLENDFSNLVEGVELLRHDPKFAAASKSAGETLRSYGGLPRALDIVEAAAEGMYLEPDAEVRAKMNEIDPFFLEPQSLVQWISLVVCVGVISILVLACGCCCRCFCGRCFRSKRKSLTDDTKKQQ